VFFAFYFVAKFGVLPTQKEGKNQTNRERERERDCELVECFVAAIACTQLV
jgi:hypothetical protein